MRKRTSKILSIVLASAMVLSMHSMAFADEAQQNEITYADGVTVIKNATDPVSWNGANWREMDALLSHEEDNHLINDKKKTVSEDHGSASYNVIPLEGAAGSYLLFGYGSSEVNVNGEGWIPVTTYDGRKKVFKGGSASKHDAFDGYLTLVKYDASAKTVTKVDGVELTDFKMDKNNVHATISGSSIPFKDADGYTYWRYPKLEGKTTPTFTLKAKVNGKNIDSTVKKAIGTALKKATFSYEILPKVVYITGTQLADENGDLSENTVGYDSEIESSINASNLNKSGKATLSYWVYYSTKKGSKSVEKKLNPKEYTLKTDTVAGEPIVILDSFNTTDFEYNTREYTYRDDYTGNFYIEYAAQGYKLCFREKGEKKNKTVTKGIYKSNKDVFVTSVD